MISDAILVDPRDNVATALRDLTPGCPLQIAGYPSSVNLTACQSIKAGHKLALQDIQPGAPVIKYGQTIGLAISLIAKGSLVHVHNVEGRRGRGDLK